MRFDFALEVSRLWKDEEAEFPLTHFVGSARAICNWPRQRQIARQRAIWTTRILKLPPDRLAALWGNGPRGSRPGNALRLARRRTIEGVAYWLSAWVNETKDGVKYMSSPRRKPN